MENKNALIYARVSTEEQAKEGYSIGAQKNACYALAKKLRYKILGVYTDEGRSATIADRPQFQAMIKRCKDGDIGAVIVYNTDRFARNIVDHFTIKKLLENNGVKLLSVMQPHTSEDTPSAFLSEGTMALVNEYYSRDLGEKTKRGLNQKFEEGW